MPCGAVDNDARKSTLRLLCGAASSARGLLSGASLSMCPACISSCSCVAAALFGAEDLLWSIPIQQIQGPPPQGRKVGRFSLRRFDNLCGDHGCALLADAC